MTAIEIMLQQKLILEQLIPAQALENFLQDSSDSNNTFSFKNICQLDEREDFPVDACHKLEQWGLQNYYIPKEMGGNLYSFETILFLIRLLARRDLTIAIGHGKTYLGASPIWVAGSLAQKQNVAAAIKAGKPVALALTEKAHGSDLAANEVAGQKTASGYSLSGEKWLINNATRAQMISLFCQTDNKAGMRGFSLLLIEKDKLEKEKFSHLAKILTHGIRGADISGITFSNTPISSTALIGKEGQGLEITLKSLQISRTMCASLSLGAVDTAIRLAVKFALTRKLYNGIIGNIKYVKEIIVHAFICLFIAEALAIVATRCLHFVPQEMSLISSIVKYFVPTIAEKIVHDMGNILGARSYLEGDKDFGIYQKISRDNKLIGLFDGSAIVNLQNIAIELSQFAKKQQNNQPGISAINNIFSLDICVPAFNPEQLSLSNKGHSTLLSAMCSKESISSKLPSNTDEFSEKLNFIIKEINNKNWLISKVDFEKQEIIERFCWLLSSLCLIGLITMNKEWLAMHISFLEKEALINYLYDTQILGDYPRDKDIEVIWNLINCFYKKRHLFSLLNFKIN